MDSCWPKDIELNYFPRPARGRSDQYFGVIFARSTTFPLTICVM